MRIQGRLRTPDNTRVRQRAWVGYLAGGVVLTALFHVVGRPDPFAGAERPTVHARPGVGRDIGGDFFRHGGTLLLPLVTKRHPPAAQASRNARSTSAVASTP